jgi:hypothetical protein
MNNVLAKIDWVNKEMKTKCGKCSEKLGAFITYVPGMGDSCIKCLMSISSIVWADGNRKNRKTPSKIPLS